MKNYESPTRVTNHGEWLKKKEVRSIVITGYGTKAYLYQTNHPRWTREELPEEGMGLAFFGNAVQYIRSHLV